MRESRIVKVSILAIILAGLVFNSAFADTDVHDNILEALNAIDSDRPVLAKQKLQEVLKEDKYNYHALVLLGQLQMRDLVSPNAGQRALEAEKTLLLATVSQPHRPEAYLALAELYYDMGYMSEGDRYAKLGQNVDPESYEAYCLLGQRYEDSGNYTGAFNQYWNAYQTFGHDSYIVDKLFIAASRGGLQPYYEIPGLPGVMFKKYPDFQLLNKLRRLSGDFPSARGPYELPVFRFSYCRERKNPKVDFDDLYAAFIKASVKDPSLYDDLRRELDQIRSQALAQIKPIKDNRTKAKSLYLWLKKKVLRKYDLNEGILAQQVLKNQKYLCLNAAILYTLISREAGLPVFGVITPGHAYAVLNDPNRRIQIELTAEPMFGMTREEGFDVDWWEQFKVLNRVDAYGGLMGGSSERNIGQVTPDQLTAYQFTNVLYDEQRKIKEQHKDELDHREILKTMLIRQSQDYQNKLIAIRGKYANDPKRLVAEVRRLKDNYEADQLKLRDEIRSISDQVNARTADLSYKKGRELIRAARSLAPTVEEFVDIEASIYISKAHMESKPAKNAAKDREMRQAQLLKETLLKIVERSLEEKVSGDTSEFASEIGREVSALQDKVEKIKEEGKAQWPEERKHWKEAINILARAIDELPCNKRLTRAFEATLWNVAKQAELNEDVETRNELVEIAMNKAPNSDFVIQYREQQLGGL
jgi:hypothetical protein